MQVIYRCAPLLPHSQKWRSTIGGFRDTYLGRQVVSRPGEQRAGMESAGSLGERGELL